MEIRIDDDLADAYCLVTGKSRLEFEKTARTTAVNLIKQGISKNDLSARVEEEIRGHLLIIEGQVNCPDLILRI